MYRLNIMIIKFEKYNLKLSENFGSKWINLKQFIFYDSNLEKFPENFGSTWINLKNIILQKIAKEKKLPLNFVKYHTMFVSKLNLFIL